MIWLKYVYKENRDTNYYDVGAKWFNTHKVVWNKWFANRKFIIVALKRFNT